MKYNTKRRLLLKTLLASGLALQPMLPLAAAGTVVPVLAQEIEDPDQAPVLVSSSGTVWNGEEPIRISVQAKDGTALDQEELILVKGADKYELRDGWLSLKEGQTAPAADEIVIQAKSTWYDASQLLWNENLETEGSLIPSVSGKYCLNHSETLARHGSKAGTTVSQNVKDGMWSPAINSTGTLVFWYYDPGNPAEQDQEALKSRTSFDQMKFGMTINNYPDFIFGTAIPASGDKGASGQTMTLDERIAYTENYVVRYGGNWKRTSIARSEGWHRMEVKVTDQGTTLKVDEQDVTLQGESTPLTIASQVYPEGRLRHQLGR